MKRLVLATLIASAALSSTAFAQQQSTSSSQSQAIAIAGGNGNDGSVQRSRSRVASTAAAIAPGLTAESELVTETGCNCGMLFAMTVDFQSRRRKDHGELYCPAGHRQNYLAETREEKLKRELDRAKQNNAYLEDQARIQREMREAAERQAAARKGQITKLKKRAAAGSCPCCRRTFSNMAEHMRKQHPGFVAEEVA